MARKMNKRLQAQKNADSGSVPQPQKSQPSQARAQAQQPKPKPKAKPKPKPTATGPSINKTEQRHQAKPKTANIPTAKLPGSAPKTKTAVKTDKAANDTGSQARFSQRNRQPNMARNPQTAKLDLPDYVPLKARAKQRNQPNRPRNRNNSNKPRVVFPWDLDPEYPKPKSDSTCAFKYERQSWHSLRGMDVEHEMKKQMARGRRGQLRRPSPQMTEEQHKELHTKYWDKGEQKLHKVRLATMHESESSKLFIAYSTTDAREIDPANDESILIRLLRVSELGKMLINLLSPSIGDLTALAATCKRAAACMREGFEFWDFRSAYFPIDRYIERRDSNGRLTQGGGVRTDILIISPISDEPERLEKPYMTDFMNLVQLCDAIKTIPSSFCSIILDQVPYLNVAMFELMVNTMPNLKTVTITRCLLLDVTKLRPLLEVIKRHPRRLESSKADTMPSKPEAKTPAQKRARHSPEEYIRLDFFPFFFRGPNSGARLGSYGVTYHEPTFNTPKAVFGLILYCWTLAKEVGMDLVSDSSSFWSFVRQLPGPDVLWAMKAREALTPRDHDLARRKKSSKTTLEDFADDLTAALTGDNQSHPKPPVKMNKYRTSEEDLTGPYWRRRVTCPMCQFSYPVSLFPIRADTCWCCKMHQYVNIMEDSHLRLWQETTMHHWLRGLPQATTVLHQLPLVAGAGGPLDKALYEVRCTDWVWEYYLGAKFSASEPYKLAFKKGYSPPPPKTLEPVRVSMARWRQEGSEVITAFDYRKGGPQLAHPCKQLQASDRHSEKKEHFASRWQWTRLSDDNFIQRWEAEYWKRRQNPTPRTSLPPPDQARSRMMEDLALARTKPADRKSMMNLEWRNQNLKDNAVYLSLHHQAEDCLISMSTPTNEPFNLDKPVPDPVVNEKEYTALLATQQWRAIPYGGAPPGFW
ncbi:hypothetical protein C8A00DRAFT_13414 [Chaetomidium leptoderma]|uniref:Uncharacterized protein n=1 Tax=Chaetomidium leptoderma TaxID=669021 RepID=A0AAN6VQ84_9PEZI|nr:hypothetical protein C8A00DRAFT_13414 [Chaetomidium leptoderma]